MSGNVQRHEDYRLLPWAAAFAMSCPPQPAEPAPDAPVAVDGRPMVAVVEAICAAGVAA